MFQYHNLSLILPCFFVLFHSCIQLNLAAQPKQISGLMQPQLHPQPRPRPQDILGLEAASPNHERILNAWTHIDCNAGNNDNCVRYIYGLDSINFLNEVEIALTPGSEIQIFGPMEDPGENSIYKSMTFNIQLSSRSTPATTRTVIKQHQSYGIYETITSMSWQRTITMGPRDIFVFTITNTAASSTIVTLSVLMTSGEQKEEVINKKAVLSGAAVIGLAAGAILLVLIIGGITCWKVRKNRRLRVQRRATALSQKTAGNQSSTNITIPSALEQPQPQPQPHEFSQHSPQIYQQYPLQQQGVGGNGGYSQQQQLPVYSQQPQAFYPPRPQQAEQMVIQTGQPQQMPQQINTSFSPYR